MADILVFPKSHFRKWRGFSIDMGSSALKVAYVTEDGDNVNIYFTSFSNDKLQEALTFIKSKVMDQLEPGLEVKVTGISATAHVNTIETALNVRLKALSEISTMGSFGVLFDHQPWDTIFHHRDPRAVEFGSAQAKEFASMYTPGCWKGWPYMSDVEGHDKRVRDWKLPDVIQYPLLLHELGSTNAIGLYPRDGSYQMITLLGSPGGRTFLGLGSLLTDQTNFHELAEMASKGDVSKVDQFTNDLKGSGSDDAFYAEFLNSNLKIFSFGHGAGKHKADFRREDLAAALVSHIASCIAEQSYLTASLHKIQQVVFYGGLVCAHPYMRQEIEKEFVMRRFTNFTGHLCECLFLRHGSHCGSLWALLHNLEYDQLQQYNMEK